MARQAGFWDYEEHLAWLTKGGDPLVTLSEGVDFEPFRYRLEKALKRSDGSKGGRPPYDPVLMFKVLVDKTPFADWAHLLGAIRQQGSDLLVTLDAADTLLLKNVSLASFTSADAKFV